MKIGIDISLACGNKAGIGTYSSQLVENLAKIDKENQYTLFPFFYHIYHENFKDIQVPPNAGNFKIKYQHLQKKHIDYLWNQSWIPRERFIQNLDILHSTTFVVPNNFKGKLVTTIYDISFKTHPDCHTPANIKHCHQGTEQSVKKADKIIAISNHTKNDLIKHYNCDPEKIEVIYLGYDPIFKTEYSQKEIENTLKKYKISKPYIFNVGTVEPRKNIISLIKGYQNLKESIKQNYEIVIAGGKGWLNSEIYKYIKKHNLTENIKFLGYIDEKDLPKLYKAAEVFIYPSLYEGFGLPVIEAMASECPVITSNCSSLPEVGGKAAKYIDPKKPQDITEALENILENNNLKSEMIEEGLNQSKKFSWQNCAKQTLKIYKNLI